MGVQAIFGPSDHSLGAHIHSICDALDIPHLESRLDLDTGIKEFSINLYPAQTLLNNAFIDTMKFLNWTKVAIIYEQNYGKSLGYLSQFSNNLNLFFRPNKITRINADARPRSNR